MADKYRDFEDLAQHETSGIDFRIRVRRATDAFAVVAPHGGGIEPGTSEIAEAIAAGGSSVSDYVDSTGEEGFFQLQHRVYQREGEPCLVCGTPIKRIVLGGRSSHYCPKCQK